MSNVERIALLLAGGRGERVGESCPKQFVVVGGIPLFVYTLRAFENHPGIDGLYVVCASEWEAHVCEEAAAHRIVKFRGTWPGGVTGLDSLRNGVNGLTANGFPAGTIVMVHDVVRPLVSRAVISSGLEVCARYGSAVAGFSGNEAFMVSPDGEKAVGMVPREGMYAAQTPYTLTLGRLEALFREADNCHVASSQSLYTLLAQLGKWPLHISRGEWVNFKVTLPEDLALFKALLREKQRGDAPD